MDFILLFLVLYVQPGNQYSFKDKLSENNEIKCERLVKEPHYRDKMVTGLLWREYYSWNIITKKCQENQFLEVTNKIIARFESDMTPYVEERPEWNEATMLLKSGQYEMLMFRDEGPPGRYMGIPNFARFGAMYAFARQNVQYLRFALKLFRKNKFLVMLDCRGGLGHIMSKVNDTVSEEEVTSLAHEMNIGKGSIGCKSFLSYNETRKKEV